MATTKRKTAKKTTKPAAPKAAKAEKKTATKRGSPASARKKVRVEPELPHDEEAARAAAGKSLVIVESPAKAKTIGKYLGSAYAVKATVGHIRDLPVKSIGIDTEKGFEPEDVQVPAGKPVTLVFTRKTDKTCAKEVILNMADGTKLEKQLPLDKHVEFAATFPAAGKLGYACGMDMIKGTITVQ